MENIFDSLFPITGKKAENNKIIKLEMEIEKLRLCLRMSQTANNQRKEAMEIMKLRLEEQDALIKRLNKVLKNQDLALAKLQYTMRNQQEKLNHLDEIDSRMEKLYTNQAEIIEFSKQFNES